MGQFWQTAGFGKLRNRLNGAKRPTDSIGWRRAGNEEKTVERSDLPTRLVGEANRRVECLIASRLVKPVFMSSMKEEKQDASLPKAKKSSVNAVARQLEGRDFDGTLSCVAGFYTKYGRRQSRYLSLSILLLTLLFTVSAHSTEQQSPDGDRIGRYLQQQYSINDAVFLTQKAWQLSHSFASEEQMLKQWQDALELIEKNPQQKLTAFPKINSHATAGQLLIQYSNGMDLQLWRVIDLPQTPSFDDRQAIPAAEKFQIYLDLPQLWQQLLQNNQTQANWLTWTIPELKSATKTQANDEVSLSKVLQVVQTEATLQDQLKAIANRQSFDRLQTAILRQQYHKNHNQPLAYGYDWIEIYQLLETGTWLLTAAQQQQMQQLLKSSQAWWVAQKQSIDLIDRNLFVLIQQINNQLPEKFKNPDHINPKLNQQVFKFLLDLSDPKAYFELAARQQLQQNLEICLNLSAEQAPNPQQPINEKQFKSCLKDFVRWADTTVGNVIMTGGQEPIDDPLQIHFRLNRPDFQNINLLHGLLLIDDNCRQQLPAKANPIEWILAAESLAWFADRWPGLIAELPDQQDFIKLKQQGQQLFSAPQCLNAAQALHNRFKALDQAWQKLKQAVQQTTAEYRQQQLIEGSQIDFFKANDQNIKITDQHKMTIVPCDLSQSCGAFVELTANSAAFDLFPNHLKMAEQFGMGELKLCYDSVKWVNRETAPTHLNNDKIANYTGQLSINIKGKYDDQIIFSKTITGEQRYLYLFAANTQQVMEMGCPVSIIGKKISTKLDRGTFGLFPNRLTFLTAQRTDINTVLENNWNQAENWLTKLTNKNSGVFSLIDQKAELKNTVNQTFLKHSDQLQQKIYGLITAPGKAHTLSTAALNYFNQRQLLKAETQVIFHDLFLQPQQRQALSGTERLPDQAYFKQNFEQQTNLLEMLSQAQQRLEKHRQTWSKATTPHNSILPIETEKQL